MLAYTSAFRTASPLTVLVLSGVTADKNVICARLRHTHDSEGDDETAHSFSHTPSPCIPQRLCVLYHTFAARITPSQCVSQTWQSISAFCITRLHFVSHIECILCQRLGSRYLQLISHLPILYHTHLLRILNLHSMSSLCTLNHRLTGLRSRYGGGYD